MHNAPPQSIFDEITDFLVNNPTPQEIIDYRLPEYLQARAHELLGKMVKFCSRRKNTRR